MSVEWLEQMIDGIAGTLGTEASLGTVWVRLHRGREQLVQLLVEEERR